jgi:hypothetical protein
VIPDSAVIVGLNPLQRDEVAAVSSEQVACPLGSPSACEAHREAIELSLSRGRNAMAIWQDLGRVNTK